MSASHANAPRKNLRLLMPQWQGGNNPTYQLGAQLLAWLAPQNNDPLVEVPVAPPESSAPTIEDGVFAKTDLLRQTRAASALIKSHMPDRIVTFGGDCSVSMAPFAYLIQKYEGDVAALWIDAHSDFTSSAHYAYAHGYPALNIVGDGDPEFAAVFDVPLPARNLIYVGVGKAELGVEHLEYIGKRGGTVFDPAELSADFSEVLQRIRATGASKLVVHFDLDSLDPRWFRAQLFNHPNGDLAEQFAGIATGKMTLAQVVHLLKRCSEDHEVVGLSFAEHLPWDAQHIKDAMRDMPILSY
jgi:arginase